MTLPDLYAICFAFNFFFQAEDGIRDSSVTGVQTCALPISGRVPGRDPRCPRSLLVLIRKCQQAGGAQLVAERPGRGGPLRDRLLAAAPALSVDRVAGPGRLVRPAEGNHCPPAAAVSGGLRAVPVPGRLVALGGLAGMALLLLLAHLGGPLRDGGDPAEEPEQHGQQAVVGFRRQPGGAGLAEQLVRGLLPEQGNLPIAPQPVPPHPWPF